ncbi:stage II sporulation protein P [Paenibacillus shirakamiensis]|uniref:Stage II sporulation protein P n=1 Tax=Paenibacillus shirakamiensis TaxID=1265935 RepID=A0ABS4JDW1_9BACL|nr:stage II sporulation protein P [Paenibacillus shirakamiensis]MBP1999136.1 stage II sporulation protein P [Paenibacillus shirakamiensis]
MKSFRTWNIGRIRQNLIQMLAMGRTFVLLMGLSIVFFILLGIGGLAEQSLNTSPVSSMKGLAASLSSRFFVDMVGMEIPHLDKGKKEASTFSGQHMTNFVFQLLTNVNPSDPKSLLAREVPGLAANNAVLLRNGSGNKDADAPQDYHPDSSKQIEIPNEATTPPESSDPPSTSEDHGTRPITDKVVMIYHSHPQESYNPLLGTLGDNPSTAAFDKNVGIVGTKVSKELEKKGLGALHTLADYASSVQGYNYNFSYKYSKATVKAAMTQNKDLKYFIDIHRDSAHYKKTTNVINGVSYAKLFFIIGYANPNWRKNEAFATAIHERIEKKYPGISRGIWGKTSAQGNGEYNQSFSPNSVLIEVGGIDNTQEELDRTSKILADTIAEVYWSQQKANKVDTSPKKESKNKKIAPKDTVPAEEAVPGT